MNLLIDLGNTRLKWALSAPDRWLSGAATHRDMDVDALLDGIWGEIDTPARMVMASVAYEDARRAVESWTQRRWGRMPYRLCAQREYLGVKNTYRDPVTLGADRWAALLGARGVTARACAIVDCGTAVTVDTLSHEGVFCGGVIFPGLHVQRQSLGAATAGVGVGVGEAAGCLALTTADGVAAGTLFGLAGAIERCVQEQARALGEALELFLTGGDAAMLAPLIAHRATHVPELVLKGLARVAESLI